MTNVAATGDYFSLLSPAEEAHPSLFLQALSLALLSSFAWNAFSPLSYETSTCSCLNPDSESSWAIPRTSSLLNFGPYIYSFGFLFLYFVIVMSWNRGDALGNELVFSPRWEVFYREGFPPQSWVPFQFSSFPSSQSQASLNSSLLHCQLGSAPTISPVFIKMANVLLIAQPHRIF